MATQTHEPVDWEALSPEGVWRLQNIALPIACGVSEADVAATLEGTSAWVRAELRELRDEIRRA